MDISPTEFEIIESNNDSPHQQQQEPPSVDVGSKDDATNESKKRPRSRSAACWTSNWFIPLDQKSSADGKPRAQCSKCKQIFLADSAKNGTSTLNNHMKRCPKRENKDIHQMLLQQSDGNVAWRDSKVDPSVVREMVLTLIVKRELPLKFIEYEEFRNFVSYLYPQYTPIGRNTLLSDIQKMYKKEKMNVKEMMKNSAGRISVTTDLWTSISNDGYMTLTAHYIDRQWVLHKRLIKFTVLTPPHSGSHICEAVSKILNEWGIQERLFCVTVDNASANDVFVSYLKTSLNAKHALVCKGDFFHVRCCAHVLNLIVQDGIKLIDKSVQKIRDSIKFVKSSQGRKVKFQESCEQMALNINRGLHGDVVTRWNSTYQMLEDALYYRLAFDNLENIDSYYTDCPTHEDWTKIKQLTKFLKPFDEITKLLSGSKNPTSNLYFLSVAKIHIALNEGYLFGADFMKDMVFSMKEKFNKYWERYSLILSIAAIFDPRYKMGIIQWAYGRIHNGNSSQVSESVDRVKSALVRLYGEYKSMPKDQWASTSAVYDGLDLEEENSFDNWSIQQNVCTGDMTELDLYLQEPRKPHIKDYDVLAYWKGCAGQYSDLSRMACDILAIPVSTVASESAFSAGGRVLDKYRSKLLPKNVEALICLRDWMYDVHFEAEIDQDQDGEALSEALRDVLATPIVAPQTTSATVDTSVVD